MQQVKLHIARLKEYRACQEAVEFSKQFDTFVEVINNCNNYTWLTWALRLLPEKQRIKAACHIIRNTPTTVGTVWDLLTDQRSRTAIEVAEAYADGRATREELAIAYAAAYAYADAFAYVYAAAYAYAAAAASAAASASATASADAFAYAAAAAFAYAYADASASAAAAAHAFAYASASAAVSASATADAEKWQMEYIRSLDWSFMDTNEPILRKVNE